MAVGEADAAAHGRSASSAGLFTRAGCGLRTGWGWDVPRVFAGGCGCEQVGVSLGGAVRLGRNVDSGGVRTQVAAQVAVPRDGRLAYGLISRRWSAGECVERSYHAQTCGNGAAAG